MVDRRVPSDAVGLRLPRLLPGPIDSSRSGINHGANLGDDITYSGTVSAAMEAVLSGCPAFAISHDDFAPDDFSLAAAAAVVVARAILERGLEPAQLLNVNVPAIPLEQCAGIEVTRLGKRIYQDELIRRADPRGVPYYWVGGPPPTGQAIPGTDVHAVPPRARLDHADPAGPDGGPLPGAPAGLGAPAAGLTETPRRVATRGPVARKRRAGWSAAALPPVRQDLLHGIPGGRSRDATARVGAGPHE